MAVVIGPWFPLGLVIGYAVHLIGDAVTVTGIPILFPRRKRYGLVSRKMRMVTGSVTEEGLFVLAGTFVMFALLWVATYIYGVGGIPR